MQVDLGELSGFLEDESSGHFMTMQELAKAIYKKFPVYHQRPHRFFSPQIFFFINQTLNMGHSETENIYRVYKKKCTLGKSSPNFP